MKKHFKTIAFTVLIAILMFSLFTACDTNVETAFSVTFIADGKEIKTIETKGNEAVTVPEAPSKEGYEFKGWYLDRWVWQKPFDGNNFVDSALTADVKVYAYYVEKDEPVSTEYDITFYAFGEVVDTVTTAGNETVNLPSAPVKENYEFKGWYLDENVWNQPFTADYFADKALTDNVSVYAKYEYSEPEPPAPNEYDITFYAFGEVVDTVTTAGNETVNLPSAPVKENYEFKGWYLDENVWNQPFTADYFADKALTDNVSVYAKYEYSEPEPPAPTEYDIIFYAFGEVVDTVTTAGNETVNLPSAPVKENYEFKGWYLDENVWNQPFTADYFADKALTDNVSVYAKYEYSEPEPPAPTEYDITFYAFGEVVDTVTTAGNETVNLPSAPVKEHYEFKGWYLDENVWNQPFTADYFADKALTDNVSVYAYYERVKYEIYFYADGALVATLSSAGYETIELPEAPVKDGYLFAGWYLDENVWSQPFTADYFADKATTGSVTVYAGYNKINYTVSFDTDGGTELPDLYTTVIDTEPITSKDGYVFDGWYLDPGFTERVIFPFNVTQDCCLYAKWTIASVTFTLNSDAQITSVSGIPSDGAVSIPAYVNGVKVMGIANYAFSGNTQLVSVEVDPSITYFGLECFRNCKNLEYVKISDDVTSISSGMFNGCTSLKSIELPANLKSIKSDAFKSSGLVSIVFPESLTSVWQYAFKGCSDLVSVDMGKVKDLSQGIFQDCASLKTIEFPDTVKEMDSNYMFSGCNNLTRVIYPDIDVPLNYNFVNETAYYDNAENWENGALYVGNHLVTVDDTFKDKTSFAVRNGTVTVARLAFYEAGTSVKLTSLTLPDGLQAIGERAFENCTVLTSVNIPDSVHRIYAGAFAGSATDSDGYIGNWLIKYNLTGTTVEIKEGTVGIADGQLTDAQNNVTEVILPSTLKYIGAENFKKMRYIETVELPASLESIGDDAFNGCYALTSLNTGKCLNLVSIGKTAFSWCKVLTSLYIPKSVEYIGASAFNQTALLTLYIERQESEIPSGWDESWDSTYASSPLNIVWGASVDQTV